MNEFLNKETIMMIFNMGSGFVFALILLWFFLKLLPILNNLSNNITGMKISIDNFGSLLLSFITKIDNELKLKKRKRR